MQPVFVKCLLCALYWTRCKKNMQNQTKLSKNQIKLRVVYIWSNRGPTVSISQKLAVKPKNIQSQNSKTIFKQNLTCIFLPIRAISKYPLCHEGPCNTCVTTELLNCGKNSFQNSNS